MMAMNNSGIIYKVTHKESGKTYVGATKSDLEARKKDHLQKGAKSKGHQFQEAIGTYGPEAFSWKQIDTANTVNELAQKEKEYIIQYDCKENGYNSDAGGGFKKSVYKYDLKSKELVESFECLDDAGNSVRASKKQISRACLNINQKFRGFYWSYEKYDVFNPTQDQRKKLVHQYTLDHVQIASFSSIAEASKATGINKSCIAKVCRGERKTAKGCFWKYSD